MHRALVPSLCALGLVSACVNDPNAPTARSAFDESMPLEIPSWVSTPPQRGSVSQPQRVHRTIELGATDADRRPADPVAATAPAGPDSSEASAPGGYVIPYYGAGYYGAGYYGGGYYGGGYYGGGHNSGHSTHHPGVSEGRNGSAPVTSPQPGDDWPAVRDYGPTFPFNWSNATR